MVWPILWLHREYLEVWYCRIFVKAVAVSGCDNTVLGLQADILISCQSFNWWVVSGLQGADMFSAFLDRTQSHTFEYEFCFIYKQVNNEPLIWLSLLLGKSWN